MMDTWYFPAWNGDFRLKAAADNTSVLEIIDPSAGEESLLSEFFRIARKRKWTRARAKIDNAAYREIKLSASVAAAGKVLVGILKPGEQSLTAIKYEDEDIIEVVESANTEKLAALLEPKTTHAPTKAKPAKEKKKKAASVKRPTACCPRCIPGAVDRASEVLLSFLSTEQHEQWAEHRTIEVHGHMSGHTYVLAHRHTDMAQQMGFMCGDLTDGGVLHFHDWSVPPEEEVLAAKIILEHREDWLRHEATCLGGRIPGIAPRSMRDVFKNPFGDFFDGIPDSVFTQQVGQFFLGMLGRDHNGRPIA